MLKSIIGKILTINRPMPIQVRLAGEDSIVVYCCVEALWENDLRGSVLGMDRLSFHAFSDVKTQKGKLWSAKIHCDLCRNFVVNQNTKVCSLHFTEDDYVVCNNIQS